MAFLASGSEPTGAGSDDTVKFLPPAEFQPTVLDKLEAHCLEKRAYLCLLLRWLEDDWIRFPAVSKVRHCRQ